MPKIEFPSIETGTTVSEQQIVEKNTWSEEDKAVLLGNMMRLNDTDFFKTNPVEYKNKCIETLHGIHNYFIDNGAVYYEDVSSLYNEYTTNHEPLIVRRDDPVKIAKLISGENIELHFDPEVVGEGGDKYANSALWPHGAIDSTTGIANAFLEGRNKIGPIVMVAGFENNEDHMELVTPGDAMRTLGSITRQSIKILSGEIHPEDLEFVVVRASSKFVDPADLTESEKQKLSQNKLEQIFRGYKFGKK